MKASRLPLLGIPLLCKVFFLQSCANIIPPTGGPRDSLPPKLINANPPNNSTRFGAQKIVFTFDEFLELKDIQQNLTVTPVPVKDPLVEFKLRTITVRMRDSLHPNTTYSIDFGKSIRDINEGNVLKNFSYTFSTGTYIDSMELQGQIFLAATGTVDSSLIAMLHTNMDDSAVIKEKPRYMARCDTSGHFHFTHLKPGTYRIYALKDDGGAKKYLSKSQLFAFADSPVQVSANVNPVTLYAYADTTGSKPATTKKSSRAPGEGAPKSQDKDKVKRLVMVSNAGEGPLDILGDFLLQFQVPLKSFDSSKIRFTDEKFNEIKSYRWQLDSNRKKLTLVYKMALGTSYHVIAAKDFAEDTLGQHLLKADTIDFHTRSEADYGSLRIRFINLSPDRKPVLQFMQGDAIKKTQKLTTNLFFDKLFLPGDYELRILYDDNGNGVWDPGVFFKEHRQPEKVIRLKKKLTVRGNFDNQVEYIL